LNETILRSLLEGAMLSVLELEDCLREIPPLNVWELWRNRKLSEPVRIEPRGSIYSDRGQVAGPVAVVHAIHFPDGTEREVLTVWNGGPRDFSTTKFLQPGRTGNKESNVRDLIIHNPKDQPEDTLRDTLRAHDRKRGWAVVEAHTLHS
jgi:hypothetical protein